MKMKTLLNMVYLMDHTGPVYPSGAGGQDIYTLHIHMDGHRKYVKYVKIVFASERSSHARKPKSSPPGQGHDPAADGG